MGSQSHATAHVEAHPFSSVPPFSSNRESSPGRNYRDGVSSSPSTFFPAVGLFPLGTRFVSVLFSSLLRPPSFSPPLIIVTPLQKGTADPFPEALSLRCLLCISFSLSVFFRISSVVSACVTFEPPPDSERPPFVSPCQYRTAFRRSPSVSPFFMGPLPPLLIPDFSLSY